MIGLLVERAIDKTLREWASKAGRKPLALFGARQTGKTTSLLQLGETQFSSVVHADFIRQPSLRRAFEGSLEPTRIIRTLEAMLNVSITPGQALLILDEIQECDEAITSLKYFCTDMPHLHVATAGSLLGIHVARVGTSFPVGHVDMLTMHPMSFQEFCIAQGKRMSLSLIEDCARDLLPCPLHQEMIELYKTYLLVGGMPEAVRLHAEGASMQDVRIKQRDILTAYVADMTKYASAVDSAKILATWESVPQQLAKDGGSTKFVWRNIQSGARADRYKTALDWLVASGLVSICTRVTDGESPLKSFEDRSSFKLYLADTGLLSCAYDATASDLETSGNRTARFRGGLAENYVMQQLVSSSLTPYYWGVNSVNEVDFVTRLNCGIVPIEVKSGTNIKSKSLRKFMSEYACSKAIVLSANDFSRSGIVENIPLYAAHLIARL